MERAVVLECRALQVFTKNASQWAGKPLDPADVRAFRSGVRKAKLAPLSSHASYLINLASAEPLLWARSVDGLVDEIARCDAAGIRYLVLHPGSHCGAGEDVALDRVARGLDAAARRTPRSRAVVLLETAAGQGSCVGHRFEHLAEIRKRADAKARIAFCLDTCHVHAAGYDIVTKSGWRRTVAELEATVGLSRVKVIHANDSKRERGSHVDRHQRIGHGAIGERGFANLMTEPAFENVPKILETPKDKEGEWDRQGLAALRRLAGWKGRSDRRDGPAGERARPRGRSKR